MIGGVPGLDSEDHNHAALYEAVVWDWEWISTADLGGLANVDHRSALDRFFRERGYRFTTLRLPTVPVTGERMPLAWQVGARLEWIGRMGSAVKRRGLRECFGIAIHRIAGR